MKTRFLLIYFLVFSFAEVFAQSSISFNFTPLATSRAYEVFFDEFSSDYGIKVKNVVGAQIGYERKKDDNKLLLFELAYYHASLEKVDFDVAEEDLEFFEGLNSLKNYNDIDFSVYFGKLFNQGKRVQFPCYWGVGAGYLEGGFLNSLNINFALKARIMTFLTQNLAIGVGATFKLGLGMHINSGDDDYYKNYYEGDTPAFYNFRLSGDWGLSYYF